MATARDLYDLTHQVAFVTGAGSGLGRSIAVTLAEAGAFVFCADISSSRSEEVAAEIAALGFGAEGVGLDVTCKGNVDRAIASARQAKGRFDILCNIAGIPGDRALVVDIDENTFDRVFAVHFKGTLFASQAAARVMTTARRGAIVNMVSTALDTPGPTLASYAISKAAVAELTKVLACELGPHGIRVNAVAPGYIETPLSLDRFTLDSGTIDATERAAMARRMEALSPLGRLGVPDDVAHQVLYLSSAAASFVTGQTLRVNGGASMPW